MAAHDDVVQGAAVRQLLRDYELLQVEALLADDLPQDASGLLKFWKINFEKNTL
jgi:hypothetical protein